MATNCWFRSDATRNTSWNSDENSRRLCGLSPACLARQTTFDPTHDYKRNGTTALFAAQNVGNRHQIRFRCLSFRRKRLEDKSSAVPMMQSAQARHRNYGCFRRRLWLDRSAGERIFTEAIVNSIFVVVVHVIAEQPTEMWFVQRDDAVENLSTSHPWSKYSIALKTTGCTIVSARQRPG
jgi:hypothetical protein